MTAPTITSPKPVAPLSSSQTLTTDDENFLEQKAKAAKEASIVSWATKQFSECRMARIAFERQWYVNMAMYFGKQNIQVVSTATTTTGFSLKTPKAPPWRVRLVINRMRPTIRKHIALLTQKEPSFFVVPAGDSDEDLASSKVAEAILDSYYREQEYKLQLKRAVWWGSVVGTSFTKTFWDPDKLDCTGVKGCVTTEPVSPFHIYAPDMLSEDIEKQPYIIHGSTMTPSAAKAKFNIDVQPNVAATTMLLEDQFLQINGIARPRVNNQCLVLEFWIKPNKFEMFPEGALLTIVGDKIVQNVPYPYKHNEFPFAKFDDIESGKFYGTSVLEDSIPVQRELNRTRSQIVEAKNLMAKPKLVAQRGSVNAAAITSEPGQVILYTPGFQPPQPLALPQLPTYVETEVNRLQADIEDLTGQHDLARLMSSHTSATALSYVQDADALMLAGAIMSIEMLTQKTGRQVIALWRQYVTTPRVIKIVGDDEAFETQRWKNSDIKDNTEIYVETGSALPYNRAGRQAMLMDMFKLGLISDPNDALDLMDIGGIQKIQADILIDRRQANRENLQMVALGKNGNTGSATEQDPMGDLLQLLNTPDQMQPQLPGMQPQLPGMQPQLPGMPPQQTTAQLPVNDWDNHQVHISIHNRFRKTQEFMAMPDEVKQIFQAHVALHQQALQVGTQTQPLMPGQPQPSMGMGQQQQGPQLQASDFKTSDQLTGGAPTAAASPF